MQSNNELLEQALEELITLATIIIKLLKEEINGNKDTEI